MRVKLTHNKLHSFVTPSVASVLAILAAEKELLSRYRLPRGFLDERIIEAENYDRIPDKNEIKILGTASKS